mgnify:CR=1 FL=1
MPNSTSQKFQGYDVTYISSLLKIVTRDVQNNEQIENMEYLDIVESSCGEFNNEFEKEFFDNRE